MDRIADLQEIGQRRRFVGRAEELDLFRCAVANKPRAVSVLHVHGPGGIGKTALLGEFARLAAAAGRLVFRLDARSVEPSPPSLLRGLRWAMGVGGDDLAATARDWPAHGVLLIDTYELLAPLDAWIRDVLLPQLPASSLVVIAGRNPPHPEWSTDPRWAGLTQALLLQNLPPEQSAAYLSARGIPVNRHAECLELSHGHPLALALLAEVVADRDPGAPLELRQQPDILHVLLQRLVDQVPTARHRQALAVSAIAHTTTEALLIDLLGGEAGPMCFDWLRGRSYFEHGPRGIFPHDTVREVLHADLRWRSSDSYEELDRRVREHFQHRLAQATGLEQQRLQLEVMFVLRHHPGKRSFFAWDALGQAYAEPAAPADAAAILEMVRRHEGEESARIAHHWLVRQPEAFKVFRTHDGVLCGFMAQLALHQVTPQDALLDPAVSTARAFMERHGPPHPGEEAIHLRFWMDSENYQAVTQAVNLTAANSVIHWVTHPALAWNFVTMADPVFWQPHFHSINILRSPEADFEVAGHRYGIFSHDWRREPAALWQVKYPEPEGPAAHPPSPAKREAPQMPEAFSAAVHQALRDCTRPLHLAANPLLHIWRLVDPATGEALQALLRDAAASLSTNPKDQKLHRALWITYFEPAATQEQAAELLGLPFSTYRYHLTRGIRHVTAWLWQNHLAKS